MGTKSITFACKHCGYWQKAQVKLDVPDQIDFSCPSCSHNISLTRLAREHVTGCVACGCKDLYQHKDFNKKLGLAVFLAGVALSFYTYHISLIVALIIDAAMYPFFPWMSVCYRCHAEMRGWQKNPELDRFNHEIGAHYEYGQEKAGT